MNPENIVLSVIDHPLKDRHTACFHLYEAPRVVTFIDRKQSGGFQGLRGRE